MARTLSLEDFGRYALITSLLLFLSKATDLGTNSLYVAKSITYDSKKLLSVFYSLKLLLIVILIPTSVGILTLLKINDPIIILIFILGLIAYWINLTLYSLFQKHEQYLMLILVNSIMAVIKLVFAALILFSIFKPTVTSAFLIFSLSVYPSILFWFFLPKELKNIELSLSNIYTFFKEAFPAGIALLLNEGWSAISNSIAKIAKDFSNVGIYSLADKLATVFSLISFSVFTVLLPKNAIRKKQKKTYDFKETAIIAGGIFLLAIVGIPISKVLVVPIFGNNFESSLPILYILLFANAFRAISTFMENYFFVEKQTTKLLPISTVRIVSFLLSAYILIPIYSISGIAWASLISSICVMLITVFSIRRNELRI